MTNRKHEAFDARVYEAVPEGERRGFGDVLATVREALPDTRFRELLAALQRLRRAGKVQHVKMAGGAGWERVSASPASPAMTDEEYLLERGWMQMAWDDPSAPAWIRTEVYQAQSGCSVSCCVTLDAAVTRQVAADAALAAYLNRKQAKP